jgi:hypothetical protein
MPPAPLVLCAKQGQRRSQIAEKYCIFFISCSWCIQYICRNWWLSSVIQATRRQELGMIWGRLGLKTATFSEFGSAPWALRGLLRCGRAAFRRPRSCFDSWCGRWDKSPTQPHQVLNIVHSYKIKTQKNIFLKWYIFWVWNRLRSSSMPLLNLYYTQHHTEATSLDWKISVFGKSQCSATACWLEI